MRRSATCASGSPISWVISRTSRCRPANSKKPGRADPLRRLLDRGLLAHRGKRHAAGPRPAHLPRPALGRTFGKVARLICDVKNPDGSEFEGCPRTVLKRITAQAAKLGYTMMVAPEAEFFLFRRDQSGAATTLTHDVGGYFDLTPIDQGEDARRAIVAALERLDYEVEAAHHEVAFGQHEVDIKYSDALLAADNIVTFRFVVRKVALDCGCTPPSCPSPCSASTAPACTATKASSTPRAATSSTTPKAPTNFPKPACTTSADFGARARILRHHQPAGQLLQTPGARLRSADPHRLVLTQPLAPGAHPRPPRRQHTRRTAHARPSCNPYLAIAVMLASASTASPKSSTPATRWIKTFTP